MSCLTFGTPQGWHRGPCSFSSAYGSTLWWGTPGGPQGHPWPGQTDWRPLLSDTRGWSETENKVHSYKKRYLTITKPLCMWKPEWLFELPSSYKYCSTFTFSFSILGHSSLSLLWNLQTLLILAKLRHSSVFIILQLHTWTSASVSSVGIWNNASSKCRM